MFGCIFFLFFLLSPLYAWGIITLMDKYVDPSSSKNTFSFGDELVLLVGIILWITAFSDVQRENEKLRLMLDVIAGHDTLMDTFVSCVKLLGPMGTTREFTSYQGPSAKYYVGEAVTETLLMIIVSSMLFLWESSTGRDYSGEGAELLRNFADVNINQAGKKNVVQDLVAKVRELNKSQTMGITMVSAIQVRIYEFEKSTPGLATRMQTPLTSLRSKCEQFEIARETVTWRVISWFTGLLSLLYLLAAPFLMWFGQGWFTMATYPVLFLFVGGQIAYRWFIGNIFTWPTDMHIQRVYDEITALAVKADLYLQHIELRTTPIYSHLVTTYQISRTASAVSNRAM